MTPQQIAVLNALVTYAAENIPGGPSKSEVEVAQIVGRWALCEHMVGVWIAFHFDFSGFAIFPYYQELEARRYADEQIMSVHFIPFGEDVQQVIRRL